MPSAVRCAARDRAHAVAQADAVVAALAARSGARCVGKITNAPRGGVSDVRAALRARALLQQHELAALVVDARLREHGEDLEREVDVAVEVLVQRVPVALAVAQDQRRRALLAGGAAALEQLLVLERERVGASPRRRSDQSLATGARWR